MFVYRYESVCGSQLKPPRWVKKVNREKRDSSSDQISNSDESQIEEDLQLSIYTKYNSISFQQACPSQMPSYDCQLVPGLKMMI